MGVALGFKGSDRGSKLGPVANNGENIASGKAKFGDAVTESSTLWDGTGPASM